MIRFPSVLAVTLAVLVSGTACTEPRTPAEVSDLFWQAVRDRDAERVRRLSSTRSAPPAGDIEAVLPVGEVTFGRTIIDEDTAWVETTVEVLAQESVKIPLRTRLTREGNEWRVAYDETVDTLRQGGEVARVFGEIRSLTDRFSEEAETVLDDVQRALPEVQRELQSLEQRLRTRLPELRRQLEELGRQLQRSIKEPPKERRDRPISA
jgi:hypothetical protein